MSNLLDDLFCAACGAYAHAFLDACPACGSPRAARYEDALARGALGYGKLLDDPRLDSQIREVVMRYTLKVADGEGASRLRTGLAIILDALPYAVRVVGPEEATSSRAHVQLAADDLIVQERNPSRQVARIPFETVLAARARGDDRPAGAWAGLVALGRRDETDLPAIDGDLVLTYATDDGPGRLALANRRGITAVKARPDHYVIAARGLAVLAAAAAEGRWSAAGADVYAVELGLAARPGGPAATATGAPASPAAGRPDAGRRGPSAIPEALATLEELRGRGLVTETEYAEKRREILARL